MSTLEILSKELEEKDSFIEDLIENADSWKESYHKEQQQRKIDIVELKEEIEILEYDVKTKTEAINLWKTKATEKDKIIAKLQAALDSRQVA